MKFRKLFLIAILSILGPALAWSAPLTAQSLNAPATPKDPPRMHRLRKTPPLPLPTAWKGLIGKFGRDRDVLNVLEKNGKINVMVGKLESAPLEQISTNIFRFPASGPDMGKTATFARDVHGDATALKIGAVTFPRLPEKPEDEGARATPLRNIAELRREALAAHPPVETGKFLPEDLVDVTAYDPTIKLDIRYATSRNFLGTPVYREARAFLQRPAAEAMARASKKLRPFGYGLLIHDAYRPWYVTKIFWDATPDDKKIFVANPAEGSRHNRGCAVDLTLYNLKTGKPVEMTGGYDETSERSYADYPGGTSLERWHRDLLREAMESEGFKVYPFEWWHFDYQNWQRYPILNLTFEQLDRSSASPPHS